ncbi:MAG: holo-ACP synthase [Candidatus Marinimicrobia bacterium]|jgi:holo-[acyl-carrier protein] synthase|nr:holo-ACP synthase [Candidatus Neomarinimicrobiota bacterium]MBT3618585.1 holo-ACP synthase [Candidatus Neomarinimicrobiota bacterium]MBT3828812.1 holo-ACP synthase [Candidatus Neomarinimicrobiota bacterium]MBT3996826.1 holo-ACP synthase [Candidatus Neomarinimicrobiota bacterium]MBT4281023.1 holo-ACP synthase [Candidatus Neomarinimicrobiota bacterium]
MNSTEPNWFIGTDIVSVPRISSIINKEQDSFISRIFTKGEISYCGKRNNPAIHYAGRFAAKEALKKAILSYNPKSTISLKKIEIQRLDSGEPHVNLNESLDCKVSISHTEEFAIAFAIVKPKI